MIVHRFPRTGDFKSSGKKYTLESEITKLIVYSTVETMFIAKANIWTIWTPGEPRVFGYAVAVREGMNIICLCWTKDSEEWPEPY